jgi:hypothetical protein
MSNRSAFLTVSLVLVTTPAMADSFDVMMQTLNSRVLRSAGVAKTIYDVGKAAYENAKANDARAGANIDRYNRKKAAHDAALPPEQRQLEDYCQTNPCISSDPNPQQPQIPENRLEELQVDQLNDIWLNGPPDPYPNEPDPEKAHAKTTDDDLNQ